MGNEEQVYGEETGQVTGQVMGKHTEDWWTGEEWQWRDRWGMFLKHGVWNEP